MSLLWFLCSVIVGCTGEQMSKWAASVKLKTMNAIEQIVKKREKWHIGTFWIWIWIYWSVIWHLYSSTIKCNWIFCNQGIYIQLEVLSLVLRNTCVGHRQISNGLFLLAEVSLKQWPQTTTVHVSVPYIMDTLKIQPNTVVARLKKSMFWQKSPNIGKKTKMAMTSIFGENFQNVLYIYVIGFGCHKFHPYSMYGVSWTSLGLPLKLFHYDFDCFDMGSNSSRSW